jgi:hypothetical protein
MDDTAALADGVDVDKSDVGIATGSSGSDLADADSKEDGFENCLLGVAATDRKSTGRTLGDWEGSDGIGEETKNAELGVPALDEGDDEKVEEGVSVAIIVGASDVLDARCESEVDDAAAGGIRTFADDWEDSMTTLGVI